jgi:hypothetical protein
MASFDWVTPATWQVGDTIDAATWITRVYNPISLLLRRPIMVAHNSADQTVSAGGSINVSFDTVDNDDDGIIVSGLPATSFVFQRSGAYHIWWSLPFMGSGSAGASCKSQVNINGAFAYSRESQVVGTSTSSDQWRGGQGEISVFAGDVLTLQGFNATASIITIKAAFNAPRLVIMWKRPLS